MAEEWLTLKEKKIKEQIEYKLNRNAEKYKNDFIIISNPGEEL